jgi:hypothetical protein
MAERPPYGREVPEGYELVAVVNENWRLTEGKRCRRQGAFRRTCGQDAVAEIKRSHSGTIPAGYRWWPYCALHLYGNWIENSQVMHWILRDIAATQESENAP